MVTGDDEPAPAATPWWRETMVWANTYQSWIYPVLIGVLYLCGRVSAESAYRAYGLSTQDVGFGVEDGVTAVALLLVLVCLAAALGQLLVPGLTSLYHHLKAKPEREWSGAVFSAMGLGVGGWVWFHSQERLEQQTAFVCSTAVLLSMGFGIAERWDDGRKADGALAQESRRTGFVLAILVSLITFLFQPNWHGLPQEKKTTTSGAWPTFLVLAPHPRAFTIHSIQGVAELANGACVYSFGTQNGFTALWGPVGSSTGKGRLVRTGIDQLTAGCG